MLPTLIDLAHAVLGCVAFGIVAVLAVAILPKKPRS
jgi:hypothetical protein